MYWNIFNKELMGGNHKVYCLITELFSPKELLVKLPLSYLFYFSEEFILQCDGYIVHVHNQSPH